MSPREIVAIVEDDPDILKLVTETLDKGGLETLGFTRGDDFLRHTKRRTPDAVVLDLMLPDTDGLSICRQLRAAPETAQMPVLILTAKGEETDKVLGLELGADDYVTKPFSPRELLARVRALLRRKKTPITAGAVLELAGLLELNPEAFTVTVRGRRVELTSTEFRLLRVMLEGKGRAFSRDQLLDALWGNEKYVVDRTIDVHIKNLRDKLGAAGKYIKSIRSVGYKIEE
ncbi:MAG TPA: response regulator transcription factor [Acidobacteriota bacterium]|nr:response regulator transcription factor [Acidobacteriota bacterium]HNR38630.1 response regulator transcription factor [Acidobacteriota bacterium]HNU01172.1 response regulator transcription factor [Acidobacteriota bacterium]HPB28036.1 response regulator transcription factor [Acidobacteriota bacterium]HQO25257.1 response regulator transcription factor [Acidobacteriota bacterium]